MELWEKVILEWINCLEVQKKLVKNITELQDEVFYNNFLKLIKWKELENFDPGDIMIFIEKEYPTFKVNKNDDAEHIYIASLLLMHSCRALFALHDSLQFMCNNLKNETQIRVKAFLESILPIGKDITKETMREVIMEVEDTSTAADSRRTPPVEDFSASPLTRSGRSKRIMTERVRELRDLRCSLAIERFTNADLRDDISRQQNKVKKLQKKLDEKSAKIKELRENRFKANTPQPSHTKQDNSQEDYYKRYINDMESQLNKQQDEINKLETERDAMSKELCCMRRTYKHYKENFSSCEQSLESLLSQVELKDRELIELRMYNEELRTHMKEFNKNANLEQSFEVEDILSPAPKSLNTSEVLSSVIEVQLQEAKEESAILHAQIDSLKGRMDILTKDYKNVMESNRDLQERAKTLDRVQTELNNTQKELDVSHTAVASLQTEKISLIAQNEDFKTLLSSREERLSEMEQSNVALTAELDSLKLDLKNLNELLENENAKSSNLSAILAETKLEITEHLACIHKLTDERDSYKSSIENCIENLKDVLHYDNQFIQIETDKLNNSTLNDFAKYFETMLHNCNVMRNSYESDIAKLNTTINETNINLLKQQLTVTNLEEQNKQTVLELGIIKGEKDLLLNEQKEIMHMYSQETKALKEIRDEKLVLEQNVHELMDNLTNRESLLKYITAQLEDLQNVNKDFKLIKEETQQNFGKYKKDIELTFENFQHGYYKLYHNYDKMQQEKEKLEHNFNCNKEELSKIQATNSTLQQNLLENEEKISTLEKKERILYDELNDSKRNVQELKDVNRILEQMHKVVKTETNDKLERLKSDNAKMLLELKEATDELSLLHQEMSYTVTQMELKEAQVNELLADVSALKTEKNDLMHSHKETLEAKDKEIEMKEEALLALQIKLDKLTSEANDTKKKMKEIIINLQEIRSNQDAVLTTQEAALKEKCLYIEKLQEQFHNSEEILNKELEDTKSALREYHIKFLDLENQLNNQNRTTAELQDTLKTMNAELETSKEYCKHIDASQAEIVKLCQELEHPTKHLNSTITEMCSDFDLHDIPQCIDMENKYKCINIDNNANILNIIKMTLYELHKSQKIILHLSRANAKLNETLAKQKVIENSVKDKEEVCGLKNKIRELEIIAQKRNNYLKNLIKNKESLKDSLQKIFATRNDLDTILTSSNEKWNEILTRFPSVFYTQGSVCDEFKQLQIKKINLESTLLKCQIDYSENIKSVCDILWEKFLWTEQKLHDTYLCSIHEKECLDILTSVEDQFSNERMIIDIEFEKYKTLQIDIMKSEEEIESFTALATSYDNSLKSGEIKTQVEIEKKLQKQVNQLTKEKKDLKGRMDAMRLRNVKLEKSIDELRTEIKKFTTMTTETMPTEVNLTVSEGTEVQSLKEELAHLKQQNQQLHEEKDESNKMAKQKVENQLKEIHTTYEGKLENMKQKMKIAYNEQIAKLNKDQEKILQEKLQNQMEIMCQRQREEINRYKAHVGELSSQLWNVGEKLLIEQQHKQDTLQRLKELEIRVKEYQAHQPMATFSLLTCKMEKQEIVPENAQRPHKVTTLVTEETIERRHSIRSIQAMGNVFKTEDEEEIFDNVYLTDMKRGNFMPVTDVNRLSILRMRNSLCKPHLKSSYPAEMQFLPTTLTEEEIKTGSSAEENFNDSLSQSLLPEQKIRKKDRSQISYKKPGPPTPSKNGGRLSMQNNELRSPSSHILKERNVDRKTSTPHSLKNIFSLKRQDENATSSPKGRRLSNLFRKSRLQSDR